MEYKTKEDAISFREWLRDAILEIFLRFAAPQEVDKWGKALLEDERALDRALAFSDIPTMLGNIHGGSQLALSDWIKKVPKALVAAGRSLALAIRSLDGRASAAGAPARKT
jgi:hypothetical protein